MTPEQKILASLFARYEPLCASIRSTAPRCDAMALQRLCREAIDNGHTYPADKMHRWLGFIQGVLAVQGLIDVDTEREYTRPLFHSLNNDAVKTFSTDK